MWRVPRTSSSAIRSPPYVSRSTRYTQSGRRTHDARASPGRRRGASAEDTRGERLPALGSRRDRGRARAVTSDDGAVRIWDRRAGMSSASCAATAARCTPRTFPATGGSSSPAETTGRSGSGMPPGATRSACWVARLGPVHAAAFSPDGALVVGGGVDRVVRVWRTGDGRLLHALRGHTAWIEDAAFSRDGREFATAGGDSTTRIWATASGRPLGTIRLRRSRRPSRSGRAALSQLATTTASCAFAARRQRSCAARRHCVGPRLRRGRAVARLGERRPQRASVGARDRSDDRRPVAAPFGRGLGALHRSRTPAPDGGAGRRRTPVGGRGGAAAGGPARRIRHDRRHAVAADTGDVATAGGDGTVRVWTETGRARLRFDARIPVGAVAISSDGGTIVAACDDGTVRLWRDGRPGKVIGRHEGAARAAAFSPDGGMLATSGVDHRVQLWDVDAGERVGVLPGAASVEGVAFSPDGRMLATADADGRLDVWNVRARRLEFRLRWPRQSFRSVAVAPDGRIAVGTDAGAVRMADVVRRDWGPPSDAHTSPVEGLAFAPDGATFVTASVDGDARIWDASRLRRSRGCVRPAGRSSARRFCPTATSSSAAAAAFVYGCDTCRDGSGSTRSRRDASRRRSDRAARAGAGLTSPGSSGTLKRGDERMRRASHEASCGRCGIAARSVRGGVSRARSSAEHRPPERARPRVQASRARSRPRRHRRPPTPGRRTGVRAPPARARWKISELRRRGRRHRHAQGGAGPGLEAGSTRPQRGGERSFVRWSDEDCWTTNPCEFVMPNEPVSMVAILARPRWRSVSRATTVAASRVRRPRRQAD